MVFVYSRDSLGLAGGALRSGHRLGRVVCSLAWRFAFQRCHLSGVRVLFLRSCCGCPQYGMYLVVIAVIDSHLLLWLLLVVVVMMVLCTIHETTPNSI